MKKILLFGGTSEEHGLLAAPALKSAAVTMCVASEYGRALLPEESDRLTIRVGRLDERRMAELMREGAYSAVVDATHPYAAEATRNIRSAAQSAGVRYLRLLRDKSDLGGCVTVPSAAQAADEIEKTEGNVLLTTGSKELGTFTRVTGYAERLYPRVLPTVESIETCVDLGFQPSHIVAMQGPFSKDLNAALMRQLNIRTLVTKDGGRFGGFAEKLEAARELHVKMIVVRRPDEAGLTQDEVIRELTAVLEEER